jgi:hypothetical protein
MSVHWRMISLSVLYNIHTFTILYCVVSLVRCDPIFVDCTCSMSLYIQSLPSLYRVIPIPKPHNCYLSAVVRAGESRSLLSIIRILASLNVLLVKEVIDRFLDLWDFWREFGLITSAWPATREGFKLTEI